MTNASEKELSNDTEPTPDTWKPALKEAAWALLAAAVLLIVVYALAFKHIHPEFVRFMGLDAKPATASGKDFIPVSLGKGRKEDRQYIIEDFNGDEAILALPRGFRAEDYPFIKVNLSGFTRYSKAKILWQQAGDPTTHALELNRSGDQVTQIAMVYGGDTYTGPIDSIALLFYDGPALGFENNNDVDIVIETIEFRPFSAGRVAEQIFEDWTNPPLWQAYSSNLVTAVHPKGVINPSFAINLVLILSMIILGTKRIVTAALGWRAPVAPATLVLLCVCAYGWSLSELLRSQWQFEQLVDSKERYVGVDPAKKNRNHPLRCAISKRDCKSDLLPYF